MKALVRQGHVQRMGSERSWKEDTKHIPNENKKRETNEKRKDTS